MPVRSPRRLTRALAGALVMTALAAPAASARPDASSRPQTTASAPAVTNTAQAPPTVTRTIDDGFDVGSAAIGAGGAAAALLLTAAGATAISRRRIRIAR